MTQETTASEVWEKIHEIAGEWAVGIDGKTVMLLSLSPGALSEIQNATGYPWSAMLTAPTTRLDVAEMLVAACAEKIGASSPLPIADTGNLLAMFVKVGGPQLPDLPDEVAIDGAEEEAPDPTGATSTAG